MSGDRDMFGRREEDRLKIEVPEENWREAAANNRRIIQTIQNGYVSYRKITSIALAIAFACLAFSLIRQQILIGDNTQRVNDIQHERFDSFLNSCEDSNLRNRRTIVQLNTLIAAAASARTSKQQRLQIEASKASTILLIDDLAPYRPNCVKYAQHQIQGGGH